MSVDEKGSFPRGGSYSQPFKQPVGGPNVLTAPLHGQWDHDTGVVVSDEALNSLEARFGSDAGVHRAVLNHVVLGTDAVNHSRDESEKEAVEVVRQAVLESDPGEEMMREFLRAHQSRVEQPLKFIKALSQIAMSSRADRSADTTTGFYIFGENQCGLWDTPSSDAKLQRLGEELLQAGLLTNGYREKNPKQLSYKLRGLGEAPISDEAVKGQQYFGLIRRRRPVADVALASTLGIEAHTVKLFKESNALVVCRFLEPNVLGAVIRAVQANHDPTTTEAMEANMLVGKVFERAITEEKGKTLSIVPLTTHVVAMIGHEARQI